MLFGMDQALVTCEHSSNRLPEGYETLGVDPSILRTHVAWDIGAASLARTLADRFGCPCILGRYSRLLVDLNRSESSPTLIVDRSHGVTVAGNRGLDAAERDRRIRLYHRPYHEQVEATVRETIAAKGSCLHVSVHSFTPSLDGVHQRNCEIGVLYHPRRSRERHVAASLYDSLAGGPFRVRRNYPYRGTLDGVQTRLKKLLDDEVYVGIQFEVVDTVYNDIDRAELMATTIGDALSKLTGA